VRYFSVLVTST
ncbi:hypothetical protein VCHENC02_4801B, partial [Vibrio harveyi]